MLYMYSIEDVYKRQGKKLGFGQNFRFMMASGNAVCGSSAIAATAPVIDADDKDKGIAITIVNVTGIFLMFLLPLLSKFLYNHEVMNTSAMIGGTLQSVGQVAVSYTHLDVYKRQGYVNANLDLSKKYKSLAYQNRFSLYGYEDLELSTQILMKEAIKRGIIVKVIDRNDNFISLENKGIKQYIKQATKTSVDNYITVLMMEKMCIRDRYRRSL